MKNSLLVVSCVVGLLVTCQNNSASSSEQTTDETPEAFQESKELSWKSRGYEANLVNELYEELADQTPELKQLASELVANQQQA